MVHKIIWLCVLPMLFAKDRGDRVFNDLLYFEYDNVLYHG